MGNTTSTTPKNDQSFVDYLEDEHYQSRFSEIYNDSQSGGAQPYGSTTDSGRVGQFKPNMSRGPSLSLPSRESTPSLNLPQQLPSLTLPQQIQQDSSITVPQTSVPAPFIVSKRFDEQTELIICDRYPDQGSCVTAGCSWKNNTCSQSLTRERLEQLYRTPRVELQQLCDQDPVIRQEICQGEQSKKFWKERTLRNFTSDDWRGFRDNDPWLVINFIRSAYYIMNEQEQQDQQKYVWKFRNMGDLQRHIANNGGVLDLSTAKIRELPDQEYFKRALPRLSKVITSVSQIVL